MKVVITGGAGFLGLRLTRKLLELGHLTDMDGRRRTLRKLVVLDSIAPSIAKDPRLEIVTGDITNTASVSRVVDSDTQSVFHLASVVSGQAEADFDLGMQVNLDASRDLLDICRQLPHAPKMVFASSVAVFGGALPAIVPDANAINPQSSYGTQKALIELLIDDYSRRGHVDGRSLRLPTVSVRPGAPNAAASSFASGIIREPLAGKVAVCPVHDNTLMWLTSPDKAIDNLVHGHELPAMEFGTTRTVSLPGLSVSVAQMVAALERIAGSGATELICWQYDEDVDRIVSSWPGEFDASRAQRLGFVANAGFDEVIHEYIDEAQTT